MGYEWWRGWSAARALGWSVGEGLEVRRACGPTVFTTHEEEEKKVCVPFWHIVFIYTSYKKKEVFGLSSTDQDVRV